MISHILVKSKAKLVSLQNPGQPMGWPGCPVATALYRVAVRTGAAGASAPTEDLIFIVIL